LAVIQDVVAEAAVDVVSGVTVADAALGEAVVVSHHRL
jgi:hypothetical protein